jgi:ketosteroid isomerase-like protein
MASQPQLKLDELKLAMVRTNELFNTEVVGKRNLEALDEIYTSDARILPPDAPIISGREGIKKFWSDLIQAVDPKSAALESLEVIPTGEGALEIGRVSIVHAEGQLAVKYVVFWQPEDGRWKWHVDIWNQNG